MKINENHLSTNPNLHGHKSIVYDDLFGQEVGSDCRLVLIGKLFGDKLIHQRSFADTAQEMERTKLNESIESIK